MKRRKVWWAIVVRALVAPVWYPFVVLAWVGERADSAFWWIEAQLPRPTRAP